MDPRPTDAGICRFNEIAYLALVRLAIEDAEREWVANISEDSSGDP